MKVAELNKLATELVGDGKKQNVFFVTVKGNVVHEGRMSLPSGVDEPCPSQS